MKASEVHKMSIEEIDSEEKNLRGKLYEMRTQAVTQKLENPRQITNIRRDIARLLTERSARKNQEKA